MALTSLLPFALFPFFMKNALLARLIAVILVPCLVADPATASAYCTSLSPMWERVGVRGREKALFQVEALSPLCRYVHKVIPGVLSRTGWHRYFARTTHPPAAPELADEPQAIKVEDIVAHAFRPGMKITDIGSGENLAWGAHWASNGLDYLGVDWAEERVRKGKQWIGHQPLEVQEHMEITDGNYLNEFPSGLSPADIVTLNSPEPSKIFVDHVRSGNVMKWIGDALGKGGWAFIYAENNQEAPYQGNAVLEVLREALTNQFGKENVHETSEIPVNYHSELLDIHSKGQSRPTLFIVHKLSTEREIQTRSSPTAGSTALTAGHASPEQSRRAAAPPTTDKKGQTLKLLIPFIVPVTALAFTMMGCGSIPNGTTENMGHITRWTGTPLIGGGIALALCAAGLGYARYRRWRKASSLAPDAWIEAVVKRGDAAVPELMQQLSKKEKQRAVPGLMGYHLINALRQIGSSAIPALHEILLGKDTLHSSFASSALRRLGWQPSAEAERLAMAFGLNDVYGDNRQPALEQYKLGPWAIEPLERILASPDRSISDRVRAAECLGAVLGTGALPVLTAAFERERANTGWHVPRAIVEALGHAAAREKTPEVTETVARVLHPLLTHPRDHVRQDAAVALRRLAWHPAGVKETADYLSALYRQDQDGGFWERVAALGDGALPVLQELLSRPMLSHAFLTGKISALISKLGPEIVPWLVEMAGRDKAAIGVLRSMPKEMLRSPEALLLAGYWQEASQLKPSAPSIVRALRLFEEEFITGELNDQLLSAGPAVIPALIKLMGTWPRDADNIYELLRVEAIRSQAAGVLKWIALKHVNALWLGEPAVHGVALLAALRLLAIGVPAEQLGERLNARLEALAAHERAAQERHWPTIGGKWFFPTITTNDPENRLLVAVGELPGFEYRVRGLASHPTILLPPAASWQAAEALRGELAQCLWLPDAAIVYEQLAFSGRMGDSSKFLSMASLAMTPLSIPWKQFEQIKATALLGGLAPVVYDGWRILDRAEVRRTDLIHGVNARDRNDNNRTIRLFDSQQLHALQVLAAALQYAGRSSHSAIAARWQAFVKELTRLLEEGAGQFNEPALVGAIKTLWLYRLPWSRTPNSGWRRENLRAWPVIMEGLVALERLKQKRVPLGRPAPGTEADFELTVSFGSQVGSLVTQAVDDLEALFERNLRQGSAVARTWRWLTRRHHENTSQRGAVEMKLESLLMAGLAAGLALCPLTGWWTAIAGAGALALVAGSMPFLKTMPRPFQARARLESAA